MNWESFEERYPAIAASLLKARKAGRLAHAHLVVSANPGIRKGFPPLLAALAACREMLPDGRICGNCKTCRQILSGTYPETYVLSPCSKARQIVVGNDEDDADTLRWFESRFYLTSSSESGWKIGIVQDADRMNESAQNAFLKTLEEPPRDSIFILATGSPAELLPTIRSRCQSLPLTDNQCRCDFPRCDEMPSILMDLQFNSKGDIDRASGCADRLLDIADTLQGLADDAVAAKWEPVMSSAKDSLESAGIKIIERRIAGESASEYKRMREEFISLIHAWFAQVAMLASGTSFELLPNPELMEPLRGTSPESLSVSDAFKRLAMAERLLRALQTNASDSLAMRSFCLGVALK